MPNKVLDAIMGSCVADALGVPVEFTSRHSLANNPVVNMRSCGTFNLPAGTWSDDTSMTLCLLDSLSKGLDYQDIMTKFYEWFDASAYTPYGETFDVGFSTTKAMKRFAYGIAPLECGGTSEQDNGNGSLMRILPVLFYLQSVFGNDFLKNENSFEIIHNVSALTHAHKRSQIACGIYISIAVMLGRKVQIADAVKQGIELAFEFYEKTPEFAEELSYFDRLAAKNFAEIHEDEIKSSGYVVDTLEASIWCLLNTNNYHDCVLKAVNLGEDTDTVAAVAGGLAGLYYGYENIPEEWVATIARREFIEDLCGRVV